MTPRRRSLVVGGGLAFAGAIAHNLSAIGDPVPVITVVAPAIGLLGVLIARRAGLIACIALAMAYGLVATAWSMWAGVGFVMPTGITLLYHLTSSVLVGLPMFFAVASRHIFPIAWKAIGVAFAYAVTVAALGLVQEVPGVGTWHPYAYGMAPSSWGQALAGLGGVHLVVFGTAAVQGLLASIAAFGRPHSVKAGLALGGLAAMGLFGMMVRPQAGHETIQAAAIVAVLPDEIAERWWLAERTDIRPSDTERMLKAYRDLIARAVAAGADLIVMPENAVFFSTREQVTAFQAELRRTASDHGVAVVAAYRNQEALRNEAVVVGPYGVSSPYYKRFLVPDVEASLTPGSRWYGSAAPFGEAGPRLAVRICFDNDYPAGSREAARGGATLMVNPTEDWVGIEKTHLAVHTLRSAETGVPMIRSALNGYSAVIDSNGVVQARALSGGDAKEVLMLTDVPVAAGRTIYTRLGDLWVKALIVLGAFGTLGTVLVSRWGGRSGRAI